MGRRIAIIGTTGSGKTALAKRISKILSISVVELDALYWEPGWVEVEKSVFRSRTIKALSGDSWIVDGNYGELRDITWGQADTLVWLDYPLLMILGRLVPRCVKRAATGELLWNGNRETWDNLFSRDSLILFAINSYGKQRKNYPELIRKSEYSHLNVHRFKKEGETKAWLRSLKRE